MKKAHLCLLFLLVLSTTTLTESKRGSREVILDNDKVQVVRLIYPSGTESGMHTHQFPNRTVYFIKGGKLELISDDKNKLSTILDVADGKILYLPATTHNVKNIGNTEVILIENEIK